MVKRTAGSAVDADAPLMEAGLDSLGSVEFRNRVAAKFEGVELPETLVFDFPTLRQLEGHLNGLAGAKAAQEEAEEQQRDLATMPPSPRLSARRISMAYSTEMMRISAHRISETVPSTALWVSGPPWAAALAASFKA